MRGIPRVAENRSASQELFRSTRSVTQLQLQNKVVVVAAVKDCCSVLLSNPTKATTRVLCCPYLNTNCNSLCERTPFLRNEAGMSRAKEFRDCVGTGDVINETGQSPF
jgi:hypothetical protein